MKKLLVTGGAGFIGANFIHYWMTKYQADKVVVLDALTYAGDLANLDRVKNNKNFTFVHGDICNQTLVESLLVAHEIDILVHFAAESHVDRSITEPDAFIETNIIGTYSLLKAAKKVWLDGENIHNEHRFHHVSTDEVYGTLSLTDPAFTEYTAYAPNSPYSASKAASDHLVRAYHHTYGLNVTTSNCSNNYGPFQNTEKLIPLIISHILHNKALPIYGDGKQIRDWLYVDDHAYGIDLILQKGVVGETYNIGGTTINEKEWTNIELVTALGKLIEQAFNAQPELSVRFPNAIAAMEQNTQSLITYVADRQGHDRRYAINSTKISTQLGYKPKENFESGLAKTVAWYLNR